MIYLSESHTRTVRTGSYCEIEGMCFWVTLRSLFNGESERAAVVEDAYELNVFLTQTTGVEIAQVQTLCPPSITGRPHWSLEELRKIVIHRGLECSQSAVVYGTTMATYKLGDLDLRKRKRSHSCTPHRPSKRALPAQLYLQNQLRLPSYTRIIETALTSRSSGWTAIFLAAP